MIDITPYYGIFIALITSIVYSLVAWKASNENFSEAKFARTIILTVLVSLGISTSGMDLGSGTMYVNAFASTITSLATSKALTAVKPVPQTVLASTETTAKTVYAQIPVQIPVQIPMPASVSEVAVEAIKAEAEVEPPEVNVGEVNRANAEARTRATGANAS